MEIDFPHKVLIKEDVSSVIDEFLKELNIGKKICMVCSENIYNIIGNKIKNSLNSFDVNKVAPENINGIASCDLIIGMGGGKTIDIAKYTANIKRKKWIAFPTVLSHDGIVSSRAILHKEKRISVDAKEPSAIIADINTIKNAPYKWIAAGCGDMISNISSVEDWKIAEEAGREKYHTLIGELALISSKAVEEHINDIKKMNYHGIEILMWSLISSGFAMNMHGSSRPCSGSEHNFSHAIDSLKKNNEITSLHGEQVALGTLISTYMQGKNYEKIRSLMKNIGLPVNAKEIGIDDKILLKALEASRDIRKRYTILNGYKLDEKECENILKKLEIIE